MDCSRSARSDRTHGRGHRASGGLGLVTARELDQAGARVVLAVRTVSRGEQAARAISGRTEVRQLERVQPGSEPGNRRGRSGEAPLRWRIPDTRRASTVSDGLGTRAAVASGASCRASRRAPGGAGTAAPPSSARHCGHAAR